MRTRQSAIASEPSEFSEATTPESSPVVWIAKRIRIVPSLRGSFFSWVS